MKRLLLLVVLIAALFVESASSQTSIYLGYENGPKWDKFNYINSKGFSTSKPTLNFICGGYVGFRLNRYTLETGLYYHYTGENNYEYDRTTGKLGAYKGGGHSSGDDNFVIPLRFGVEFKLLKNTIFIKPEIGLTGIIAREYTKNQPSGGYFENTKVDSLFIPTNGDSTISYYYRPSKFNLGYEVSLTAGFRIKNRFDIYLKGSVFNSFKPIAYETITYFSDSGNETATNMFHGNSYTIQIGLRYFFEIKKKK